MPTTNNAVPNTKNIWPKLITFSFIFLVIVIAVSLLPRGFSQDLSVIGQGTNAIVLVHDGNILQSTDTMAAMNAVRDDFEEYIAFIVADINTPEGKRFADSHGFGPAALAFFAANGDRLQVLYSEQTSESLRRYLNTIFNYNY
ncbi:hypothetical protein [Nitrosomonas ureae]|uniref:Uncharacterized protein n=1 Tax=Nitrosomonas ureae TaxID=44577 RepID=A0A1H5VZC5_9PROT|nr:hypothetical protein [Nitrosomonas ureae]SEF92378.1 hypothetical protein SAMN05216334_11553 [Nitrosomonas ureae]